MSFFHCLYTLYIDVLFFTVTEIERDIKDGCWTAVEMESKHGENGVSVRFTVCDVTFKRIRKVEKKTCNKNRIEFFKINF